MLEYGGGGGGGDEEKEDERSNGCGTTDGNRVETKKRMKYNVGEGENDKMSRMVTIEENREIIQRQSEEMEA